MPPTAQRWAGDQRGDIALSRRLDTRVQTEEVETEAQMELIKKLGYDEAQGYLLGRRQLAEDVSHLLLGA